MTVANKSFLLLLACITKSPADEKLQDITGRLFCDNDVKDAKAIRKELEDIYGKPEENGMEYLILITNSKDNVYKFGKNKEESVDFDEKSFVCGKSGFVWKQKNDDNIVKRPGSESRPLLVCSASDMEKVRNIIEQKNPSINGTVKSLEEGLINIVNIHYIILKNEILKSNPSVFLWS